MKKQIKAIALSLALLTTTACGAKEAKQTEETKVAQDQTIERKQAKKANIEAPKANDVKIAKEDNRAYLIPQTVGLKDKTNEEVKEAEETIEFVEETIEEVDEIVEEVAQDIVEIEEVESKESKESEEVELAEETIEFVEEVAQDTVEVEDTKEEEVEFVAADINSVSTSEQSFTPEREVASAKAIAPATEEATYEQEVFFEEEIEEAEEKKEVEEVKEVAGGLTLNSPSAEEVRNYWKNYQSKAANTIDFYGINLIDQKSEEVFDIAPNTDLNQFNLGELSNAAELDALHIANTARFASGITNELKVGAEQRAYAQAATMVNRLNQQISHNPAAPAGLDADIFNKGAFGAENSNLASSFGILDSVVEYLQDDLGDINQLEVGHRRWVLNPAISTVGLGQTEKFNAMFVNNSDYAGENADTVYAYPGETAISEFHSAESSLSLIFGENFDITNASVEVKDLATGEVNKDAHIDQSFKGNGKAITFGYGMNYTEGTKLQVRVNGVTKNGKAYPVAYTINYMSIR